MADRLRAGKPSRYVISQLGELSLSSLRGWQNEDKLRLGRQKHDAYCLQINTGCAGKTVKTLTMRAIPQRF